jgi:hypothetical protein
MYWKFKIKGSRKFHLSKEPEERLGTGEVTLCGLSTASRQGSVRTITKFEGDECEQCIGQTTLAALADILIEEGHFGRREKKVRQKKSG